MTPRELAPEATTEPSPADGGPSLRSTVRHWLVYGLGSVASRVVGLLLLPVYTRFLSPEDYGAKALVVAGVDLAGIFFGLGIRAAVLRFYRDDRQRDAVRPEAVSTGLALVAVIHGMGVTVACLAAEPIAAAVFGAAGYAPLLRLGLVTLFFAHLLDVSLAHLQLRRRSGRYTAVALGLIVTGVALNILFVVALRWGVRGLLWSELLTHATFGVVLAALTLRGVGLRVSRTLAAQMLAYGAPLIVLPLEAAVMQHADRLFLARYATLGDVGLYALAAQLAQALFLIVVQPFANYWEPTQFEVARSAEARRLFAGIFRLFTTVLMVAAFGLAIAARTILEMLTAPPFWPAASLVPILVAAHAVAALALFFNSGLLLRRRTGVIAGIAAVGAGVNVAANALLVPAFGATGSALARLAAVAALVVLTYALSRRAWPLTLDFAGLARAAAIAVALFAVAAGVRDVAPVPSLLLDAALIALLVALIVPRSDRRRVVEVGRQLAAALVVPRRPARGGAGS